ncbi:MAG: 30S ribosomal protein S17 [Fimbriimonadia bacterium]|nr:30S ribosomal protein S17 [Fimbriimonadia bacterium]
MARAPKEAKIETPAVAVELEPKEEYKGQRKVRSGFVVSDKMQKTVVVAVQRNMRHPLYGKIVRRTKRYKAHDEHSACHVGDRVEIVETHPLSRDKRWRVRQILERAK